MNTTKKNILFVLCMMGVVVMAILTFSHYYVKELEKLEPTLKQTEKAREMIQNGSDVYIDGRLVDEPDKLLLEYYTVTIVDNYIILND